MDFKITFFIGIYKVIWGCQRLYERKLEPRSWDCGSLWNVLQVTAKICIVHYNLWLEKEEKRNEVIVC